MATYLDSDLANQVDFDVEADTFFAYGEIELLKKLQNLLEPYLSGGEDIVALIEKAEAEDFEFDD